MFWNSTTRLHFPPLRTHECMLTLDKFIPICALWLFCIVDLVGDIFVSPLCWIFFRSMSRYSNLAIEIPGLRMRLQLPSCWRFFNFIVDKMNLRKWPQCSFNPRLWTRPSVRTVMSGPSHARRDDILWTIEILLALVERSCQFTDSVLRPFLIHSQWRPKQFSGGHGVFSIRSYRVRGGSKRR
jgi:hypothetical protein